MSQFKYSTVTGTEIFIAAREVCSRLHIALGGASDNDWHIVPHPLTAALSFDGWRTYTLAMPAIPIDARLSRTEAETIMTYVTHEVTHAAYTDFSAWKIANAKGITHLVNGLEDIRCEYRLITDKRARDALPNAATQLAMLTEYCTLKALASGWDCRKPQSLAFTFYQYAATCPRVLGYDVPSMPAFHELLSARQIAFMESVVCRARDCANTFEIVTLAETVTAEIKAMTPAPAPQPPVSNPIKGDKAEGDKAEGDKAEGDKPEGDKAEGDKPEGDKPEGDAEGDKPEGDKPEGDAEGDAEGDKPEGDKPEGDKPEGDAEDAGDKAEGDKPEGDAESDAEGDAESDDNDAGTGTAGDKQGDDARTDPAPQSDAGTGQGAGDGEWSAADMSDAAQDATQANLNDMAERHAKLNGKTAEQVARDNRGISDFLNVPASIVRNRTLDPNEYYTAEFTNAIATPARLRRDITKAVRSPDLIETERNATRGRFDMRSFPRATIGAENVFKRRIEASGQTCAVSLLIDLSSSMGGAPIQASAALAIHLGDALKAAAIPFEIAGFTHGAKSNGLVMVKTYRDAWQAARDNCGALAFAARGGTAMLPGIKAMTQRMKARGGVNRRVLLVLTDGDDNYSSASNRAAIADALNQGVEVIGMGICGQNVSHVFPRCVNVPHLSHVARDGLKTLVDVLNDKTGARRAG